MNLLPLIKLTLLATLVLAFACQSEPTTNGDLLVGRWQIQEATRNGKPTESLDELYFEFYSDGKMRTNLSGSPEMATYQLEQNRILQRESRMEIDYEVEELSDSILTLKTSLRGFTFRFALDREVQEK